MKDRINEMRNNSNAEMIRVQKIDSIRDPTLKRVKSLKAMVRFDNQLLQLTVDTGSPVSFLNWATAKEIMDKSSKVRFIPSGKLNLQTKFVDYNKQPISILGALKTNLRSAGWEVKGATFLVSERKTRCIMGQDLQGQVGIVTTQKPAPKEVTRFDVLMCEQSEGWREKFFTKFKNLFDRQGISKNFIVSSKFKYPICPIQEKGKRIPIHIQDKVEKEIEKLLTEGHITKLDKCTSDCFIAPIVITVKKDDSIKLALDAKTINRQLFKNKYQMPNVDELMDGVSQIVTENKNGTLYFLVLDLKYAYSQIKLAADTAKQCNFHIVGGKATGTFRFMTGFYGLADMPAEFQKAMDRTINHAKNTFCFLDDILFVSKRNEIEHGNLVEAVLKKLDAENLALKLSKCEFFKQEVGVTPKITKTEAVVNLNPPKSLKQLRSFLGSINHLAKFIPNAASLTEKLRPLLKEKNQKKKLKNMKLPVKKFEWGDEHTVVFNAIKEAVANITKVCYYDANRETRVKCDASHDGLGATLEQQNDEGLWVPISFASRYLNAQKKIFNK